MKRGKRKIGGNEATNQSSNEMVSNKLNMIPSMGNGFHFIAMLGPYILISFFLLLSFFNQNLKGIIYFVGICLLIIVTKIFSVTIAPMMPTKSFKCSMFESTLIGDGLSFSILVYFFTLGYLFIAMFRNNIMNYPMIVAILLLGGIDIIIKKSNNCTTISTSAISIFLGLLIGFIWSTIIQNNASDLLYHTDYVSNKVACSMPSQQKFKCQVYKNGELISTMTK